MYRTLPYALLASTLLWSPVASQQACASPKPLSAGCRSFLFLDAVGSLGLARASKPRRTQTDDDLPSFGGVMVGYGRNIDSATAIAVSGEFDYALAGRGSAKVHWRRWLANRSSIDLAAGPLAVDAFRPGNGGDERVRLTGVTAEAGFVTRFGLGAVAGVDKVYGAETPGTGVHVGIHAESYWAIAAIAVTGALYAIVWGPKLHL
jgi:hypothetical protein